MADLQLGLTLGYWGSNPPTNHIELAQEAERLGYDSVWTAEAYGSDALTPLAWIGANTQKIRLGTGVLQLSARAPTATAMAAMTMDHLSNGRMTEKYAYGCLSPCCPQCLTSTSTIRKDLNVKLLSSLI